MSYLEELLPEFRKGAKIRRKNWPENLCISLRGSCGINIAFYDVNADDWEKVPDNPIDYDYIIKNKCLCWFWDDDADIYTLGTLTKISDVADQFGDFKYKWNINGKYWKNCRPVCKDEVTFYEDNIKQ